MLNKKKANNEPVQENPTVEEAAEEIIEEVLIEEETEVAEEAAEPVEDVNPLAAELEQAKESYLRLAAEYDNFRKRTQREKESLTAEVKASTVAQLLPVIDNLDRALSFEEASEADIRKGVEMVLTQAVTIFEKLGIAAYCEPGDTFDPNLHNCIGMASVEGFESGQVTMVIQKGYKIGEKIVRPAMVQVAE